MRICVVGANHSTTPISIREKLAVGTEQLPGALASLLEHVSQGVLLSTCNRIEVYTVNQTGTSNRDATVEFMRARAGVPKVKLIPHLYIHEGRAAVRHLFRVASGLDSMIIGEYEILGQVRQALEVAEQTGRVGLPLLNLFHHAVRTGRRVRHETRLSRNALSVSSVAVDLATKTVGDLGGRHILVIGAGEAGRLVAKAARARKASQITVTSRSPEHASALADMLGGNWVPLSTLGEALRDADVVITCTGATGTILDGQLVEAAMSVRPERPLVVIDIAVPRDVEPEVRHIEKVSLYDIDDLTQISRMNEQLRRSEIHQAMKIVDSGVGKYTAWFETLGVKPTVSALVQKAEAIRRAQLDMTLRKLGGLSGEDRESLEAMTKAIVKKVLHDPVQCLKRNCRRCVRRSCHDRHVHVEVVNELFRLGDEVSG